MNDTNLQLIQFHYLSTPFPFLNRKALKQFLLKFLKERSIFVSRINYIFCSDPYLLAINREYLSHDTYTDIITFPLSLKNEPLLSDIYISIDRVRENANLYEVSFNRELHRVIFHGLLHLLGYNDKTKQQANEMRVMENQCLTQYFGST